MSRGAKAEEKTWRRREERDAAAPVRFDQAMKSAARSAAASAGRRLPHHSAMLTGGRKTRGKERVNCALVAPCKGTPPKVADRDATGGSA